MPSPSTVPTSSSSRQTAVVSDADVALVVLACDLRAHGYSFTTVSPATQARRWRTVGAGARATSLRDIFGWNLPFDRRGEFSVVAEQLEAAGALVFIAAGNDQGEDVDLVRSAVRFTTIGSELFVHSATPPVVADAVDLGTETVRFVRQLQDRAAGPLGRVLDVGAGCGAVGISLAARATSTTLVDTNPEALRLARMNAALAGVEVEVVDGDGLHGVGGMFDLIVANPPYLGASEPLGNALAVGFVRDALKRLAPGGRLILSTGAPVVDGIDLLREALAGVLEGRHYRYDEVEPDLYVLDDHASPAIERVAGIVLEVSAQRLVALPAVDVLF